jgi:type III restriction enzyme
VIKGGFTVWQMKSGSPTPIHITTLEKAVAESLK